MLHFKYISDGGNFFFGGALFSENNFDITVENSTGNTRAVRFRGPSAVHGATCVG